MCPEAADFHYEQEHPWSCIAACVCIIQSWTGQDSAPNEAALLSQWTPPKTDIRHAEAACGVLRHWDPTDPRSLERLRAVLHDRWLLVTLFPGPLTYFTMRRRPAPVSRHGPLLPFENPRTVYGLPHAVVLVEAVEPEGVLYIDPYYPSNGQPFSLADDELLEAWTGAVMIPTLPSEIADDIIER